jgi:thiamine biosynthesis protein ThiI
MMMIAEKLAEKKHCTVLITGESLGQVASQTQESMSFTDSSVAMTVFRPLIGLDKEEIIIMARKIRTFETSVEPFDDCCSIFSPERPLTRPDVHEELAVLEGIQGLEELMETAVNSAAEHRFDARGRRITA